MSPLRPYLQASALSSAVCYSAAKKRKNHVTEWRQLAALCVRPQKISSARLVFLFFLSVGKTAQRGSLCVVKEHQAHQLIIRLGYRSILNSLRRWNVLCSWEMKNKKRIIRLNVNSISATPDTWPPSTGKIWQRCARYQAFRVPPVGLDHFNLAENPLGRDNIFKDTSIKLNNSLVY